MFSFESSNPQLANQLEKSLKEHWRVFLGEGLILSILGLAAMLLPAIAGLTTTIFLGWLLLVAGAVSLVASMRTRRMPGFRWALVSALFAIIMGALLLLHPLQSMISITFLLVIFFIVDGIFTIILALSHRRELSGRWEWMLLNGIIDLFLAAIIISGWPATFFWALGLLVGVDLLFGGLTLVGMALAAREELVR